MNTNKTIEEMIASGEIGTMTECAYGSAVADTECENTLKKKNVDKSKIDKSIEGKNN